MRVILYSFDEFTGLSSLGMNETVTSRGDRIDWFSTASLHTIVRTYVEEVGTPAARIFRRRL